MQMGRRTSGSAQTVKPRESGINPLQYVSRLSETRSVFYDGAPNLGMALL